MFESLPASQRRDPHLRSIAPALTSFLVHTILFGAALITSWMTLSPIPLPALRQELFQPVTLVPRAGAPAPRLGHHDSSSTAITSAARSQPPHAPAQAEPQEISQPLETKAELVEAPQVNPGFDSNAETAQTGALGLGDPTGVPEGDPRGKRGGVCVGDCDPEGPVGLGPGDRNGIDELPPIYTPGVAGVTEPEIIESSRVLPAYPELARRARVEGLVLLQAVIRTDGRVDSVILLRESPPRLGFGEAAIQAVRRWRYRPGTQQGRAVAVYLTIHIEFSLTR